MATNMIDVEPAKQSSVPKRGLTTMKHALKQLGAHVFFPNCIRDRVHVDDLLGIMV